MMTLIARRIGWSLVVVWFVITATFAMITLIPADPAKTMLGPHATPELVQRARAYYCLDKGFLGQYGCYVGHLAHGDLGESYRTGRPVTAILASRLWPTAQLALAAIVLQLLVGIPLGIAAALRKNRWPDRAATFAGLVGQSAPTFFVGTLLLYVFAYRFGWFPIGGYGGLAHLVLPAATLATVGVAYYARTVRSELVDALGEDYIRTARAKGLPERTIVLRHGLRNALGPLVTLAGLDLGVLLGGAVVTEYIFAWPGIGREVLLAVVEVDIPLILGVVLVSAIAIAIANLLVDLVLMRLDPRLRHP
ncbi:MAG: ABC transporter permease [Deltaproteobacteria bacterium]|nr:ABC transporter permease [Deltaproteobacteria bacterium]